MAPPADRRPHARVRMGPYSTLSRRSVSRGGSMIARIAYLQRALLMFVAVGFAVVASAAAIGPVKVAKGNVSIERKGQTLPADPGSRLQQADVLKTGADGSVGVTMSDNSV